MPKVKFEKSSLLDAPVERVFEWHERPGAFERLLPPWQEARILKPGTIHDGQEIVTEVKVGPVWQRWTARMYGYKKNELFCDEQIQGPFKSWNHRHQFLNEQNRCRLLDTIEYELPFGFLGELFGGGYASSNLQKLFDFRHRLLASDLRVQNRYALNPLTILVTGASGLVGSSLISFLTTQGHRVISVTRKPTQRRDQVFYNAAEARFEGLENFKIDAVVHLAGESISGHRWDEAMKKRIYESRVGMTKDLSRALAKLSQKPKVLVCASATGYYGDRGDEELTESSQPGTGFLPMVCKDWETATSFAREAGIRIVNLRIGIVLTPKGGALQKMLPAFRMGLGGSLGSGEQWMNWIALDDLLFMILHSIATPNLEGPLNAVAGSVRNKDFSLCLAHTVHRTRGPKAPAFVLRTLAGEMADALLLSSTRVVPDRAKTTGYHFEFSNLEQAFHYLLGV